MDKFQILCVTMHQTDFSKIEKMNIHSDVVFANQADRTEYSELEFDGHTAKMITTDTRGVGINRNLSLMYADGDICLFADDDVRYNDDVEQVVLSEFSACPDADIIIFHLESETGERKQVSYPKTRKHGRFENMPWGGVRIACRLSSVKKANLSFTTLFGGGCPFPSGEDSIFLIEAKRRGLKFYVSKETIGTISFETSTWFSGADEKFYRGKGAFYQAVHPRTKRLWMLYFAWRTHGGELSFREKMKLMKLGSREFREYSGK